VSDPNGVFAAARALAAAGLVDAFGHASVRSGELILLTPAKPLAALDATDRVVSVPLDADALPTGAPKEAWVHLCVYRSRPDVGAICRAQPASVAAAVAAGVPIRALHGQGGFLGAVVPVFDEARLVRTEELGNALSAALGDAPALVMRGNGAITVASSPGRAAALMYLLERSARLNLEVAATGKLPQALTDEELDAWQQRSDELLDRLWEYLHERP
jgi:HCOMODA/2-hydroxy-3-carboxy-muconic semialdehyde decarboxylase